MSRVALDSNILAYLAGAWVVESDGPKIDRIRALLKALSDRAELIAPVQALGETFVVLRRSGIPPDEARKLVTELAEALTPAITSAATLSGALDLLVEHRLQFWDALILTAAAEAGCSLLSEDMQNGFVMRGVTVVDPLAADMHKKLARLMA